jgi:hypothetical protein
MGISDGRKLPIAALLYFHILLSCGLLPAGFRSHNGINIPADFLNLGGIGEMVTVDYIPYQNKQK